MRRLLAGITLAVVCQTALAEDVGILTPEERAARADEAQSRDLQANYERLRQIESNLSWNRPGPERAPQDSSDVRAQDEARARIRAQVEAGERRLYAAAADARRAMQACERIADSARAAGTLDSPETRRAAGTCFSGAHQDFLSTYEDYAFGSVYFLTELQDSLSAENYRYFHTFMPNAESIPEMRAREAREKAEAARRQAEWDAQQEEARRRMEAEDQRRRDAFDEAGEAGAVMKQACAIAPVPAEPVRGFRDCKDCPEMAVIPAGRFRMGATADEQEPLRFHSSLPSKGARLWSTPKAVLWEEEPVHEVTLGKPFAAGRYAVTFDDWKACAADGGCKGDYPSDGGMGEGKQPVVNVSWDMAQAYVQWLSRKTGKHYRLPTEAEREYFARAGSPLAFPCLTPGKDGAAWWSFNKTERPGKHPVGGFSPNAFGLYDTVAGVLEWVQDCATPDYTQAPTDGRAVEPGFMKSCPRRVARGAHWKAHPSWARNADRMFLKPDSRDIYTGFRVVRDLDESPDTLPWLSPEPLTAEPAAPATILGALQAAEQGDWSTVRRILSAWPEIGSDLHNLDRDAPDAARVRLCEIVVGKGLMAEGTPGAREWTPPHSVWKEAVESYDEALSYYDCRERYLPREVSAQLYLRIGRLMENGTDTQDFPAAEVFYRKAADAGVKEAEGHLLGLEERRKRGDQEAWHTNPDIAFTLSGLLDYKLFSYSSDFRPRAEQLKAEALAKDSIPALLTSANQALHPFNPDKAIDLPLAVDYYSRAAKKGSPEAIAWFQGYYDAFRALHKSHLKEYPNTKYTHEYLIFQRLGWQGNPYAQAVAERFLKDNLTDKVIRPLPSVEWRTLPAGEYRITPERLIRFPAFQVSQTLVTFRQYQACVDAKACTPAHTDDGVCYVHTGATEMQTGILPERFRGADQPVVCVNWDQAKAFAAWAGGRLLSESEYEYAATEGGKSHGPWEKSKPGYCTEARMTYYTGQPGCGDNATGRVCESFEGVTAQGICDLYGNVWEWLEDNWAENKDTLPTDGSPRLVPDSIMHVQRGFGWANKPLDDMQSFRSGGGFQRSADDIGIRVARSAP